jgi:hypothetical protein
MPCEGITRNGTRCKLAATHGSYCYAHSPQTASERRRNARRGGRLGGNGRAGASELAQIKKDLRGVISDVLSGKVGRSQGAVVVQGFHVMLRLVELERKLKEDAEFLERIEVLEGALEEVRRFPRAWYPGAS